MGKDLLRAVQIVFLQFVAERREAQLEPLSGLGLIAPRLLQCVLKQISLEALDNLVESHFVLNKALMARLDKKVRGALQMEFRGKVL